MEVPNREDYRGELKGLCGNMDGQPESNDPTHGGWDNYANDQAHGQCDGGSAPLPEPCSRVRRGNGGGGGGARGCYSPWFL